MNSVLASPLHSRWHRTMMVVPSSVSKTSYRSPSGWISLSLQVGHAIFLFLWSALSLATIVWSMVLSISRSSSIVFMTSAKRNKIELCHSHYVLISQSFSTRGKYVGRIRRAKVVAVIIMYDMEARSLGAKRRQIRFLQCNITEFDHVFLKPSYLVFMYVDFTLRRKSPTCCVWRKGSLMWCMKTIPVP